MKECGPRVAHGGKTIVLPQTSVEATQLIDEVLSARPGGQGEEG